MLRNVNEYLAILTISSSPESFRNRLYLLFVPSTALHISTRSLNSPLPCDLNENTRKECENCTKCQHLTITEWRNFHPGFYDRRKRSSMGGKESARWHFYSPSCSHPFDVSCQGLLCSFVNCDRVSSSSFSSSLVAFFWFREHDNGYSTNATITTDR